MAVRKETQNAENAPDQASAKQAVQSTTVSKKTPAAAGKKPETVDYTKYVYIGPSLPDGSLKENTVFEGSREEILDYLSEKLEEYPQIEKLLVPVCDLAKGKMRTRQRGNLTQKYYQDIVSTAKRRVEKNNSEEVKT